MPYERKRQLVQVTASLQSELGGPSAVVIQTSRYLSEIYSNTVLVFGKSSFEDDIVNINSTFFNNRFGFRFKIPNKFSRKVLSSADILIIHGYYLWTTLISLYFSESQNLFLMPHGSLEPYQEARGKFRKRVFNEVVSLLLKGRDIHFLVGSNSEAVSVEKRFPHAKVTVVGLGIELPDFEKIGSRIHSPIKLFCLSRIARKKRIDLCILAVAKLNQHNIRYHLSIYGTGDVFYKRELDQLVQKMNLEGQVFFEGHVTEVSKEIAIQNSDILLLPSENENFALAVAESISFGKPVVVSKFVAMYEFVDKYCAGFTIDEIDVESLVSAIEKVSDRFSTYQDNCIESAHLLAWEQVIKVWFKAIEDNVSNIDD